VVSLAGYIFNLKAEKKPEKALKNLKDLLYSGVYSTIMKLPDSYWRTPHEGTFADFMTMKEGDNVYFFSNRKIYGIGELVSINGECKFLNFPEADLPFTEKFTNLKKRMILNYSSENTKNRMLCTFKSSPYFFEQGVDMDEVLTSNPSSFKMLRAMSQVSFIKIDDIENKALSDVILKNNEQNIISSSNYFPESNNIHDCIKLLTTSDYTVVSDNITGICYNDKKEILQHEMALEVGVLDYIANQRTNIFGHWDYLTHQVMASPFKPLEYIDKMDIFGYRYIAGFQTISKYLVLEIKKDSANPEVINQVMKYVDFVNQEYSRGDYNMIEAFIIASDFPEKVIKNKNAIAQRNYVKGTRPAVAHHWTNLRLIKYRFDPLNNSLHFTEV